MDGPGHHKSVTVSATAVHMAISCQIVHIIMNQNANWFIPATNRDKDNKNKIKVQKNCVFCLFVYAIPLFVYAIHFKSQAHKGPSNKRPIVVQLVCERAKSTRNMYIPITNRKPATRCLISSPTWGDCPVKGIGCLLCAPWPPGDGIFYADTPNVDMTKNTEEDSSNITQN